MVASWTLTFDSYIKRRVQVQNTTCYKIDRLERTVAYINCPADATAVLIFLNFSCDTYRLSRDWSGLYPLHGAPNHNLINTMKNKGTFFTAQTLDKIHSGQYLAVLTLNQSWRILRKS